MFYRDKKDNTICTSGSYKARYVKLDSLSKVNVLMAKTNRSENWGAELEVEYGGDGYLVRLYNRSIRPAPCSIAGKCLELNDEHLGQYFKEVELRQDDTLALGSQYGEVQKYIKTFLNRRDFYQKNNLIHKLGVLLYGTPGEGKTAFVRWIIDELPKDSIKIWCNGNIPDSTIAKRLKALPQLKVLIFEELATNINNSSYLRKFLEFMDGENSMDHSLIIATTNYPHNLPLNVVERPSRFDKIVKVGDHNKEVRISLLKKFLDQSEVPDEFVNATKGKTVAQIKELCLLSRIHGLEFFEAVRKSDEHKELIKTAFVKPKSMGISANVEDDCD